MSRYSDAQFELVYATIADCAERRDFDEDQERKLSSAVFNSDRLWDGDIWSPLFDFVEDVADDGAQLIV